MNIPSIFYANYTSKHIIYVYPKGCTLSQPFRNMLSMKYNIYKFAYVCICRCA